MKNEKKIKQNDLINQKYFLNFCFIKYLLYVNILLYKIIKHHQLLHIYMFYIPFCRKFYAEFKYDVSFSFWVYLDPHSGFCRGMY
jgi:hypothetical protein